MAPNSKWSEYALEVCFFLRQRDGCQFWKVYLIENENIIFHTCPTCYFFTKRRHNFAIEGYCNILQYTFNPPCKLIYHYFSRFHWFQQSNTFLKCFQVVRWLASSWLQTNWPAVFSMFLSIWTWLFVKTNLTRSRMFVFVVFVTCDWSRERRGSGVTSYSDVCTVKIARGTQLISIPYWPWEPRLKHVISVLWWHTLPLHPDVYYRPNRTPLYSINYRDRSC